MEALNGPYLVTEEGALGGSANLSQSFNGQKVTAFNIGTDNALAPSGHAGIGYGRSVLLWKY